MYENIQSCSPDDDYSERISKPESRQTLQKDIEVIAEDNQVFLLKMHNQLTQNVPVQVSATSPRNPIASMPGSSRGTPPLNSVGYYNEIK